MINDRIIQGNCFEIMPTLPDASVQLVIADPPYTLGLMSSINKQLSGIWCDVENTAQFFGNFAKEAKRLLKPTGAAICFCNWRGLPSVIRGFDLAGMQPSDVVVWDKEWIGHGGKKTFRSRYELIALVPMKDHQIKDRHIANIIRCKWQTAHTGKTGHPAEKPVEILKHFIQRCSAEGDLVIDPFMGSGSALVAAKELGRHFIGIESEQKWCDVAAKRLL